MNKRPIICVPYTIICHGASEVKIANFLKQQFRLPINIVAKQKGKQQIEAQEFETKKMFKNHWARDLIVPILAKDNIGEVFFKDDKSFNKNIHKPE